MPDHVGRKEVLIIQLDVSLELAQQAGEVCIGPAGAEVDCVAAFTLKLVHV